MVLSLPIPSQGLSPNARLHWSRRHRLTAQHRQLAFLQLRAKLVPPCPVFCGYLLAFFWADCRRRDDDNASARCKAYRDGMAAALGVDDSTLKQLAPPAFAVDRRQPRLEITLVQAEDLKTEARRLDAENRA